MIYSVNMHWWKTLCDPSVMPDICKYSADQVLALYIGVTRGPFY